MKGREADVYLPDISTMNHFHRIADACLQLERLLPRPPASSPLLWPLLHQWLLLDWVRHPPLPSRPLPDFMMLFCVTCNEAPPTLLICQGAVGLAPKEGCPVVESTQYLLKSLGCVQFRLFPFLQLLLSCRNSFYTPYPLSHTKFAIIFTMV